MDLHDELEKEKESAAAQLAGVQADAEDVIKELRRTVEDLRGQLKQQVGFHWGLFSTFTLLTLLCRKSKC